jgi:hypothetical protein
MFATVAVFLLIAVLAHTGAATEDGDVAPMKYDPATCREKSLSSSTWPSDHGDSSRTKFTIGAGLPKGDLNPDDLKIIEQNGLLGPQWIYTYGANNEFVYAMGGNIMSTYVAKLDAKTLDILQKVYLKPAMYIGGLLMHANGHVYGVQGNTLTAYWNGDLYNATVLDLPTKLNGNAVQTNGMVVSSDGYLVIKQWSFILEDAALYLFVMPAVAGGVVALMLIISLLVVFCIPRKQKNVYSITAGLLVGSGAGLGAAVALFILVQWKLFGTYDPVTFVGSNLFFNNAGGGGELKLIDPVSLAVVADLPLVERCSFGRMALSAGSDNTDGEDVIVLIGDEFIRQYRWNPVQKVCQCGAFRNMFFVYP